MGSGPQIVFNLFGIPVTDTVISGWIIILGIWFFAASASKKIQMVPSGSQNVAELYVEAILDLIEGMIPNQGKKFLPLIGTIGLYIGVSNLLSVVPFIPIPTEDLNTTLGIAFLVFIATHYFGIEKKGLDYIKGFAEPSIVMLPMNIVGELAKPISLGFRLFGNMVGGSIIVAIISMFAPWIIPIPLKAWFDLFVGGLQAFIFTILPIAYISIARN
ncbi:F0F1 ATP synthase subunit A [Sporohalobacter salinus]|uniref:F0F1 ATP synthase subunit A n=1 Tax=Sporohalobacter salinus TaxID=1494606 RepID=UPI00195F498C|nr:F0F1 ATP synthase subunit A [Sporohalobacter salinus]MBM7622894.1 F-type H+-transporting ATPase subunit a [Sporohalobacter salinus]